MKITIVGAGYVGLANAFLMGITKKVTLIDIDENKINKLNEGISPINDEYIQKYIGQVDVEYSLPKDEIYSKSDVIFIATNTDYDEATKKFNLNSIEAVLTNLEKVDMDGKIIVIKSTIPIDYTRKIAERFVNSKVLFSPEFLREGFALHDNLHPDRIVVGHANGDEETADKIIELLKENVLIENVETIKCSNHEAEVVKLFANTYLALRIAFVNELDSFCQKMDLNTANVINAIGADSRIGRQYFNPSFGFGGYCLPKDTKQLKSEFEKMEIESAIIANIPLANEVRIKFIADEIIEELNVTNGNTVGIYRIVAKKGINNYRSSAIVRVLELLQERDIDVVIFEPFLEEDTFQDAKVINDINEFKKHSNIVVANRLDDEIRECNVFTRDVFEEN